MVHKYCKVSFVEFQVRRNKISLTVKKFERNSKIFFDGFSLTIFNSIKYAGSKFFAKIISIYILTFHNFTKIKIKNFECHKSIRNYEKKMMLGTLDAWLMSCIEDCRISSNHSNPWVH